MKLRLIATLALILNLCTLLIPGSSLAQERRGRRGRNVSSVSQNYIGVGATDSGFAAYSKFPVGRNFSLRPQILFDDLNEDFNGTVVIPITYDFNNVGRRVSPFVGVGGSSQTQEFDIGLNFTTGLDYALGRKFTATGQFNVQLFDDNNINALVGIGFNF